MLFRSDALFTVRQNVVLTIALLLALTASFLPNGYALRAAGDTVISNDTPGNWTISQETAAGQGSFIAGPATPPVGAGSLLLKADTAGSVLARTAEYAGTRLDAISALTYRTYTVSGAANRTAALVLAIDDDSTDADPAIKAEAVFHPGLAGSVTQNAWQPAWDAATTQAWIVEPELGTGCTSATPCTLAELLTALPNAAIAGSSGYLGLRAAGGSGAGLEVNVDELAVTANSVVTTFNFELIQCTTTCYVNTASGNDASSGSAAGLAKRTIGAALAQVSAGGTIIIAPGTYAEAGLVVDKAVAIQGADPLTTLVDGSGGAIFAVESSGVSFDKLTLQNGSSGITVRQSNGVINGPTLTNLRILNQSNAGVYVTGGTTAGGIQLSDSQLTDNGLGILLDAQAKVNGLGILRVNMSGGAYGLQQINNGSSGKLSSLTVRDSSFSNHSQAAISLQEAAGAIAEGNTFSDNVRGIVVDKRFTSSGQTAGDITIRDNDFTDQRQATIDIGVRQSGLSSSVIIQSNRITQTADLLTAVTGLVTVRLGEGALHAPVAITDNQMSLTGARPSGVQAVHGLQIGGSVDQMTIANNVIDGGGVGSSSDTPASSALYLQTDDALFGALDASTALTISANDLTNFDNGLTLYDPVTGQYGRLDAAATVTVSQNNINDNNAGAANGAGAELDARRNWWGDASGPGGEGPGSANGVTANVLFCPWLDAPAPGGSITSGSGGFATTSTDNHQTRYCSIEEALFASQGAAQTVLVSPGNWGEESFTRDYSDSPNATITASGTVSETVLNGVTITGSTFDGLAFDGFTFAGTAETAGDPYAIVVEGEGSYTGLEIRDSIFDGGASHDRGAILIAKQAYATVIAGNRFLNYGLVQENVGAVISVRTHGGATGKELTISNNQFPALPHAWAVDVERWGDTTIADNQIQGGGVFVHAPLGTSMSSLGVTQVISNQISLDGDAAGIAFNTLNSIAIAAGNQVSGPRTCIDAQGVLEFEMTGNTLTDCSAQGLLFGATEIAPESATITTNTFADGPVGAENRSQLTLNVCNNIFQAIDAATVVNPGQFAACPVTIEKFHDLNGNRVREEGEPGLADWSFSVSHGGEGYATIVTDENGQFIFTEMAAGDYEVCEELQSGWTNTTDLCQTLTAGPGQANLLQFGNIRAGRIIFSQEADPIDGTAFPFITDVPQADGGFTLYGLSPGDEAIGGDLPVGASNVITYENVATGIYTVTESIPAGWMLTDLTCDDPTGDTLTDRSSARARINLSNSETVRCTYYNQELGGIAIKNETQPAGLVGPFIFNGALQGSLNHGDSLEKNNLAAGEYQVRETSLPTGFTLSDIRCDDENSSGDPANGTATFNVEPGEFVTCTFINALVGIDVSPIIEVSEGGKTDAYNMVLAVAPTAVITIAILPDEQLTVMPQALIITPDNWDQPHLIQVAAVDDEEVESAPGTYHTGIIRHAVSGNDPYYAGIAIRDVVAAITDNDYPGVIVEPTLLSLVDAAEPLTYTVQLASAPNEAVAIGIEPGEGLDTIPAALLFSPGNWDQPQTVLVLVENRDAFTVGQIAHNVLSTDPIYDGVAAASVVVTQEKILPSLYLPLVRHSPQ
ncbi:MAG: right-handed parallel beta-helix repeat-containing protein [Caldilineaceae bacterium]|nr:right-handed parallel beta-helix repeat-containing protein [Caldilineaceae bacterium]